MILKSRKSVRKLALLLAFFLVLVSLQSVILNAKEDERTCDEAFMACLTDGPSIWFLLVDKASFCFAGWVFCKKYVEK
jgi:hypothetical protein